MFSRRMAYMLFIIIIFCVISIVTLEPFDVVSLLLFSMLGFSFSLISVETPSLLTVPFNVRVCTEWQQSDSTSNWRQDEQLGRFLACRQGGPLDSHGPRFQTVNGPRLEKCSVSFIYGRLAVAGGSLGHRQYPSW